MLGWMSESEIVEKMKELTEAEIAVGIQAFEAWRELPDDDVRMKIFIVALKAAHEMGQNDKEDFSPAPKGEIYVCPKCGDEGIQGTAWIELNTGKDLGDDPPTDDYWCEKCQEHFVHVCNVDGDSLDRTCLFGCGKSNLDRAVKVCTCGKPYSRPEWDALKSPPKGGKLFDTVETWELKNCSACDSTIMISLGEGNLL